MRSSTRPSICWCGCFSLGLFALAARGADAAEKPAQYKFAASAVDVSILPADPAVTVGVQSGISDQHNNYWPRMRVNICVPAG